MEALLWAYGYGKPRDTVDLSVSAERKTLIIVPHPGAPKPEDEKPAVDEPVSTLALPAEPLPLLPSKSEPKTYGPPRRGRGGSDKSGFGRVGGRYAS